ncbi:MAG TPA: VTT domain-containing protein [Steroidobacteraceae bacterium]|nr:VTT domain-containing protein [Steroidobacteraceae bacterium]
MGALHFLIDTFAHLDRHLGAVIALYHAWIYGIVFVIIFAETGLVVTPFLPGDSLLFAIGALAAVDTSGTLRAPLMWALVCVAAVLGNTSNYAIGRAIGPRAFSGRWRLLRPEHLRRTEAFFARHGALTILLSRFVPLLRTFAPFVAGVGRMPYVSFQSFNIAGGIAWGTLFIWSGYLFGNIPLVKNNFGLVTLGIIAVSVVPMAWTLLTERRR